MMITALRPWGVPLNSVSLALTGPSTIGGATPIAVPEPIRDPRGQAFGPRACSFAGLHFGKKRALVTAPLGKRSVVWVSWGGAGAAFSLMRIVVRRLMPPRCLWRSRLEYLAVNSTDCVVTAWAEGTIRSAAAAAAAHTGMNRALRTHESLCSPP